MGDALPELDQGIPEHGDGEFSINVVLIMRIATFPAAHKREPTALAY